MPEARNVQYTMKLCDEERRQIVLDKLRLVRIGSDVMLRWMQVENRT